MKFAVKRAENEIELYDVIKSDLFEWGVTDAWGGDDPAGKRGKYRDSSIFVGFAPPYSGNSEPGVGKAYSHDPSRKDSLFVVEAFASRGAEFTVYARRLHDDGSFNCNGELIRFCMSTKEVMLPKIPEVELAGRLVPTFTFEKLTITGW